MNDHFYQAPPAASGPAISLSGVALATWLLPVVTVHASYLLSATTGLIPLCVPYVDGCTSISASGRYGGAYFLFKAGMLPTAVFIGAFWWLCRHWLLTLGDRDGPALRAIVAVGLLAAVFLALYTVFLGSRGEFYSFMRRFGVIVYFGGSYLAQLLLLARLATLRREGRLDLPAALLPAMRGIAVILLAVGLCSIPIMHFLPEPLRPDKDRLENVIEWNFCLLLVAGYGLHWYAWRHTAFKAALAAGR